jgi:hypothetical protein
VTTTGFPSSQRDSELKLLLLMLLPVKNGMRPAGEQGFNKCWKTALGGKATIEDNRGEGASIKRKAEKTASQEQWSARQSLNMEA